MRFIVMHRTNARWEAGELPSKELIARVGAHIEELIRAGAFLAGEGLRASSHGVRVRGGHVTKGPYRASDSLPAGFAILRVASLDEATAWSSRIREALGDAEIDVRPINEAWHIGLAPKPEGLTTERFMALYKSPADADMTKALAPLLEEMSRAGVLVGHEGLLPTKKGARLERREGRTVVIDGPFAESKELIAGYALLNVTSREDAIRWAEKYIEAVEATEVDVREVLQAAFSPSAEN